MGASFTSPWALVGLLALPLIWWLQKRLRRPPDVELPSLMFLLDEAEARALPRGRLIDAELLLALTAAALIAFAAAGPVLERRAPRTIVRVVLSGGAPAAQRGYRQRVEAMLASMRDAAGQGTRLDVRWVPGPDRSEMTPRPSADALLAEALAGRASARYVLSDAPAPAETGTVTWMPIGRDDADNTGIVAASVTRDDDGPAVFLTLAHQGRAPAAGRVLLASERGEVGATFALAPGAFRSVTLPLGTVAAPTLRVRLVGEDGTAWADDLRADDTLRLTAGPLPVHVAPELPEILRARLHHGLTAVLGSGGFVPSDAERAVLAFGGRGAASGGAALPLLRVEFQLAGEGVPVRTAPRGATQVSGDPLVRDLEGAATDFVYAPGASEIPTGERLLLARVADGQTWPVLTRRERVVRLGPDPLRGTPRPVDTPFWPLFLENVVVATGHAGIGEGYRAVGLLDPESTGLGTEATAFEAGRLAGLPATVPGSSRPLRGLLILAALACLGLLWAAPRLRRLRSPGANPHARAPVRAT